MLARTLGPDGIYIYIYILLQNFVFPNVKGETSQI